MHTDWVRLIINNLGMIVFILIMLIILIVAIGVVIYAIIENTEDQKQQIWDRLIKKGATDITINLTDLQRPSGLFRQRNQNVVFRVTYIDRDGVKHKGNCWMAAFRQEFDWEELS